MKKPEFSDTQIVSILLRADERTIGKGSRPTRFSAISEVSVRID